MAASTKSPEEKQKLVAEVNEAIKTDKLSVRKACEKVGINVANYYAWGKKTKTRRRKKIQSTTSLVSVTPETERPHLGPTQDRKRPDPYVVADLLAQMNARSLRVLLEGGTQ